MKLFEILDPITTDPDPEDIESVGDLAEFVRDYMGGNLKKLGKGAFSIVYEKPNDPGTVTKVSKGVGTIDYLKEDGYLSWLRAIADFRDSTGNPYLPKVYSIKFYFDVKDEPRSDMGSFRGPFKYVAEIERLENFYDNDWDEDDLQDRKDDAHSLYRQYLILAKKMFKDYEPSGDYVDNITDDIVSDLNAHLLGRPPKFKIKDKYLAQAIHLIKRAESESGAGVIDLKDDNIMIRRTAYGLQPVLTDPVA